MEINIIFGAPGTGKTTELLNVLEKELETYSISDIAFVSYTKEGANQGKIRAKKKFNFPDKDFLYFSTLHSMAFKSLNLRREDVIQKKQYRKFSETMGMKFTGYYTEDLKHDDDMYLFFDELYRSNVKCSSKYINYLDSQKLKFVRMGYKKFKEKQKLVDYTDMLQQFCEKDITIPVKVAIIDEAQDLTSLQWQMVWQAFRNCDKIYIAGDDDQAIYQWNGADVDYFLGLEGNIKILKKSYRLPKKILNFSKQIAKKIDKRVEKNIDSTKFEGEIDYIVHLKELPLLESEESWMVLSRNNYYLTKVEEFLRDNGIVYYRKKSPSAKKSEMEAIKLYEKIRKTKNMTEKDRYILTPVLKNKFNLKNPWFDSFKWAESKINYYRDLIARKTDLEKINVVVDTIHSQKGAEADNVVILSDITRNVYQNLNENPDAEHRCFYVACTRAKKKLYIMQSESKFEYPFFRS